jgi:dipeptidyl aminopeptidase/acylaminoacyl peptidase
MTRVIGIVHFDDRRVESYFDARDIEAQQTATASLPGFDVSIVSRSLDGTRLIIRASRNDFPPKYVWLDTAEQTGGAWLSQYPELETTELAKTARINFEAGDGLAISGYLTMPVYSSNELPPLVIYPHDGPADRSTRDFDPYVQFFASRGYAVLQINHRGSRGFGFEFFKAGFRQWGGKMQQDIYDGIAWLAAQNLVDMGRACIVGQGYGGYVALTAAHEKPRQFACFVSIGGISDIVMQVQSGQKYGVIREQMTLRVGDIYDRKEKKRLRDLSPIKYAKQIDGPVLLIHGDDDASVRHQQSRLLFQRIEHNNRNNRFLSIEDGTHSLDNDANRRTTFRALDQFLRKYLD